MGPSSTPPASPRRALSPDRSNSPRGRGSCTTIAVAARKREKERSRESERREGVGALGVVWSPPARPNNGGSTFKGYSLARLVGLGTLNGADAQRRMREGAEESGAGEVGHASPFLCVYIYIYSCV